MASRFSPDEIRRAEFRTVLRGLDANEVGSFLQTVAAEMERLTEDHRRLESRLGEFADRDLKTEFDQIGQEVSAVLEAARVAAESMRERASDDAALWRSEATAEAETLRKDARNDAEALRGDAWTTGSELLNQTMAEIRRIRQEAERDSLTITGEAEREAHRLVSSARREAEDLSRIAAMDAEKVTADAAKRRDQLIAEAYQQTASAEERTRALEERREELLEELENVRATLGRLEGTLEDRREDLDLSKETSGSVRIIPGAAPRELEGWELGETVRVIAGELPELKPAVVVIPAHHEEPVEEQPADEPAPIPEVHADLEPEDEDTVEPLTEEPSSRATSTTSLRTRPATDEVGALFASLRGEDPVETQQPEPEPEAKDTATGSGSSTTITAASDDDQRWLEDRDTRLLPITNRGLRGVKKAVTDAQNVALDSLRTDTDWLPDAADLAEDMRADLIGLWAESYSAGHTAAEQMMGAKLKRPVTPATDAADVFGEALASSVDEALVAVGDGQRERQSATSRVFRAWRTDEAERRLRELAHLAYHRGLVESSPKSQMHWVAAGTPCSACRSAAADPAASLPPVHPGCECTLVLS